MMSEEQSQSPKIIVDSNWKERVQAEKEALLNEPEPTADSAQSHTQEIPPASFSLLVTSLATQTLAALGQIADPEEQEQLVRFDVARHHIDTLNILQEKTQGNLTTDESVMLSNVLHELRMVYVAVQSQGSKTVPDPEDA
jgi:hypothetical protein